MDNDRVRLRDRPRRSQQAYGRGAIGLIVALALAIYGGIALKELFRVRSAAAQMGDFVEAELARGSRLKLSQEEVRFSIVKKATELGIITDHGQEIEVVEEGKRWRVHVEWDAKLNIPGIDHTSHFVVDKTWTRF